MKNKSLLLVVLFLAGLSVNQTMAQTNKGSWLIEGSVGDVKLYFNDMEANSDNLITTSESSGYNVSLLPGLGYFIKDQLAFGAKMDFNLGYSNGNSYNLNNELSHNSINKYGSIGIIPFIRYYILCKNPKNMFYAQIGGGLSTSLFNSYDSKSYDENGGIDYTNNGSSKAQSMVGEALFGFNRMIADQIAINTALGYNFRKTTSSSVSVFESAGMNPVTNNTDHVNRFGNIIWNFGFSFFLTQD